jgi:ATP-dependent DNA helicase DinG
MSPESPSSSPGLPPADNETPAVAVTRQVRLPDAPVLVAGRRDAVWLTPDGEIATLGHEAAAREAALAMPIVCHAPATARRLGIDRFAAYDVLELFAFAQPARSALPTPAGLAAALGLPAPRDNEDAAVALIDATRALLGLLVDEPLNERAAAIARAMTRFSWGWAPSVLAALGKPLPGPKDPVRGLDIWKALPEWPENAPEPAPAHFPVEPAEARARLTALLGDDAEPRPSQADYAAAVTDAFRPRPAPDTPNVVLAEAGTGTGKTLGYIAPASVWSEKNDGPVWISTYTRNLQRQIDDELDRLFPDPDLKAIKVVVRKGRENYLCLLNLEEAVGRYPTLRPHEGIGVGLAARWAQATRDGDFGGDFPAWLSDLVGFGATTGLADRRGECIYAACPHYSRCFIEHSVRRARRAEIVVANHALVMIQAALGGVDDSWLPTRYVFDEGHHLFDAADSAFGGHLSGRETADLRRWLLGPESGRNRRGSGRASGRSRGIKERAGDLVGGDATAVEALENIVRAAHGLPAPGWATRIGEERPEGPTETFLAAVRGQVYARTDTPNSLYDLETGVAPLADNVGETVIELSLALRRLAEPMRTLRERLVERLDREADELDTGTRVRIEAVCRSLMRRGDAQVGAWRDMLATLGHETPPEFVDWFGVERVDGRDLDVGMYRHWVDPTKPFADAVAARAHGVLVTSATLTDGSGDIEADWKVAEARTGAVHLPNPAIRVRVASPFDYAAQTRVFVVTDLARDNADQIAAAYRELFRAAGGGALGLFTAITRLKSVHQRIAAPLEEDGIGLYAQHIDALNVATLVDIFRAETDSCLLGTDAVRDGVDVPGDSLRLLVFDRVPWPRPDILHKARRAAFGAKAYDDMLTRLKLAQAYGRLIRREDDRGVFVILDSRMPSRLAGAFPEGVEVQRVGLAEAIAGTAEFLGR